MKVSICITTLNEEKTIAKLLTGLIYQTFEPDEIIIVDGGSKDETPKIIKDFSKRSKKIKLIIKRCSRSRGRNIAVSNAKNNLIAMTDAGCIPEKNWLERIINPFKVKTVDVVAGFYKMEVSNSIQKAFSVFLGVHPKDFNNKFLPSTRSIAFTKRAWGRIGGFDENLKDTAEDSLFNYKAIKLGLNFARVKNAKVKWLMPETFTEFFYKLFKYSQGDIQSKIWFYSQKGIVSHNIKILTILLRYIVGLIILIYSFYKPSFFILVIFLVFSYFLWSFFKVFLKTKNLYASIWGIILQPMSDFAVMSGFILGFFKTYFLKYFKSINFIK